MATRAELLDTQGRAIEIVSVAADRYDDARLREAFNLMSQVGFELAAPSPDVDDGYDPEYLNEEDSDADRIAEVVAMGGVEPYARYRPREYRHE